jgi:hypothetical protein
MELRKVYETSMKRKKLVMKLKATVIRNKVYNHIVYLQNQEKLYFYLIVFIKIFQKQATDVLN